MRHKLSVFALIPAALLAASGCGGSSSSNSPPDNTSVTVEFSSSPTVVAEKIGDGAWTAASPQGGTLTLSLPPGVNDYGIALLCSQVDSLGTLNLEWIIEATTADNTGKLPGCLSSSLPTTATLSGSVDASAIPGVAEVRVEAPAGHEILVGNAGPFTVQAQTGTDDIAFLALDISQDILAIKIVRSQAVPGVVNNGNVVTFSASDAAPSEPLAVTNIPAGFTVALPEQATYLTANGAFFPLSTSSGSQYAVVPPSEAQADDIYQFQAEGAASQSLVVSGLIATSAGAVSLSMPAPLTVSAPTPGPFPAFSLNYAGTGVNNYSLLLSWTGSQNERTLVSVRATSSYQAAATTLTIPDLTAISGFLPSASSGTLVSWSANVAGGTYGTTGQPTGTIWSAGSFSSYTEP